MSALTKECNILVLLFWNLKLYVVLSLNFASLKWQSTPMNGGIN